ncbi:UNKNOWN [Stylonychia lemnae]|uniref:Transmembrane protein n=1 Tax=Stylonychia lemnae TaxID=5949 RepID=A0A078AGE4_STYLE|nr:UNKNOWN [Stylonychia lemnae]|eukprot:CDW80876.1 UNKNOWN [Stylonychia lemnae]
MKSLKIQFLLAISYIFLLLVFSKRKGKQVSQGIPYVTAESVGALKGTFFQNVLTDLFPKVLSEIKGRFKGNSTDWIPIYLFKLDDLPPEDSVFVNMKIENFTVKTLQYNTSGSQSGILLLESVQQLKYYVSNIQIQADYVTKFDFSGLYSYDLDGDDCSYQEGEQECLRMNQRLYNTTVRLKDGSISVAQNFSVSDEGDIQVDLPLITITILSQNLDIVFYTDEEDNFINQISSTINKTKDYIIQNAYQLINENRDYLRDIYIKAAQMFTQLNISDSGYHVWTKFQTLEESRFNFNPYISSNYISGFQRIYIQKEQEIFKKNIQEKILMPAVDPSGDDMQIILSENLIRYLSSAVWNNSEFLSNNNPTLGSNYIYLIDGEGDIIQMPCTTDIMDFIFPGIAQEYGKDIKCNWSYKITQLNFFNINIGRLYYQSDKMNDMSSTLRYLITKQKKMIQQQSDSMFLFIMPIFMFVQEIKQQSTKSTICSQSI